MSINTHSLSAHTIKLECTNVCTNVLHAYKILEMSQTKKPYRTVLLLKV